MTIGIDASRIRSGGGVAHLVGILAELDPAQFGIREVHVWSHRALLNRLPARSWIAKHGHFLLEGPLPVQVAWQAFCLGPELERARCDVLFTADASSFATFRPSVVLSQDLLSYETGVMQQEGGRKLWRLYAILFAQNFAFRRADGVIFLTQYARAVIQKSCGALRNCRIVPHGVGEEFKRIVRKRDWPSDASEQIRCLYVSNATPYKHQREVVEAVAALRKSGFNVGLTLIGGGQGLYQEQLRADMQRLDPAGIFLAQEAFLPHAELGRALAEADIFIFASGCETFGITLLEAMAAGLPIACSNQSSLPETFQGAGVYFNPSSPESIAGAVRKLIEEPAVRAASAKGAAALARTYSWNRCSRETFEFITRTAQINKETNERRI